MRKYILINVFLFNCILNAASQKVNIDSLRIDSLKKQLTNLKEKNRVDCINDIAREYHYLGLEKLDSLYTYANEAYKEAIKINYNFGIAHSLLKLGVYQTRAKKNAVAAENNFKEALAIAEKINDPGLLGWVYLLKGDIVDQSKNPPTVETWKKALEYFKKAGDEEGEAEVSNWLCFAYTAKGDYEKGFPYCKRSVELSKIERKHNISWGLFLADFSFMNISNLYNAAGDYETALNYLRKSKENKNGWTMEDMVGTLFVKMNQPDSAFYYLKKNLNPSKPFSKTLLGEAYLLIKDYNNALPLFQQAVDTLRNRPYNASLGRGLIGLAKTYEGMKKYKSSLKYAKEGFSLVQKRGD